MAARFSLARECYGTPPSADAGEALRRLGLRHVIHPNDVCAWRYPSREAFEAFAAANLRLDGHPTLGSYEDGDGVIGVLDLRPAMAQGKTDPSLPDGAPVPRGRAR